MRKFSTYCLYLYDYLRYKDFHSIFSALNYLLCKKSHTKDRIVRTSLGWFYCRKETNDFQFANYYYEWGVKRFILKHLDEFTVFLDVGACIGDYSIWMSGHKKQCFAFEPGGDNVRVLKANLTLNNMEDKVLLFPNGLGNGDYFTNYYFNPINTGASYIIRESSELSEQVRICRLDDLCETMGLDPFASIFIKVDVEGMEREVVLGASKFIKKYSCITLIIEDKHVGKRAITEILDQIAIFEYGKIDRFNFYAKKVKDI